MKQAVINTDTIPEIVSIGITTVTLTYGKGVYQSDNPHIKFVPTWKKDYIFLNDSEIVMTKD